MIYFLHEITASEGAAVFVEASLEAESEDFERLQNQFSLSRHNGLRVGCYSQDEIRKVHNTLYKKHVCSDGDAYTIMAIRGLSTSEELNNAVRYLTDLDGSYSVELRQFKLVDWWVAPAPFKSKVLTHISNSI